MKASFIGDDLSKGFNLVASVVPTSAIKQILGELRLVLLMALLT